MVALENLTQAPHHLYMQIHVAFSILVTEFLQIQFIGCLSSLCYMFWALLYWWSNSYYGCKERL